jgi:hypothetical protein
MYSGTLKALLLELLSDIVGHLIQTRDKVTLVLRCAERGTGFLDLVRPVTEIAVNITPRRQTLSERITYRSASAKPYAERMELYR